jgi:lysozyme family protein
MTIARGFDAAFAVVVGVEGGYTDEPADPGNWTGGAVGVGDLRGTKWGISAASFPTLDIPTLPQRVAAAIYRAKYWDRLAGDALAPPIALISFDAGVNQGVGFAARTLQEAVGAGVDGVIGPATVRAAHRFDNDPMPVVIEIGARRALRYASLGTFPRFGLGWMRRLMRVATAAVA